jgi:hypothetical protein
MKSVIVLKGKIAFLQYESLSSGSYMNDMEKPCLRAK